MADAFIDTRKEAETQSGSAAYWSQQLELANKDHKDFIEQGISVIHRYKGEKKNSLRSQQRKFNILYSNTETLKAALFAQMAKPEVKRRFPDQNPVARQIATIVERAASYLQDVNYSETELEYAIGDYLLPGRGVARVCYDAETTGEGAQEYVSKQQIYEEYINWQDFRHEPAKCWGDVTWEAFRKKMSRDDLHKNFDGSLGVQEVNNIPLTWSPDPSSDKVPSAFKRAEVWEIWDKTKRQRVWVVQGFEQVLRTDDDPYGLEGFFPNPKPLQAIETNETVIPQPEFSIYQDQADGLDEIEGRIDRLTRALKRRGVYDATFKELQRLAKANDNEFVPVKNYAELSQKGGLAAAFQSEDISALANVLGELHQQRDLRVQTIYEVVGIADIMRGVSDPREKLGTQQLKAQFGSTRLKKRQDKVQKWIRDLLRIKCELIAEHIEPQMLAEMTGMQLVNPMMLMAAQAQGQTVSLDGKITPEMIQTLRNDKLRSYNIDIETDSTIFADEQSEKQAATELLTAVTQFVAAWEPVLQATPAMVDLAFEMLEFALRRFKPGRSLEDVFEQTRLKLQQAAQQPRPPDPKVMAEQAKAQTAQQQAQLKMQEAQQKHEAEMAKLAAEVDAQRQEMALMMQQLGIKRENLMMDLAAQRQSNALDMAKRAQEHEFNMEALAAKQQMQQQQRPQ